MINSIYNSRERPLFDPIALMATGPLIDVDILPPVVVEQWAKTSGSQVKQLSNVRALIDTGASVTGIDENLLKDLGYPPIGTASIATPAGTSQTALYMVRLVIPSTRSPSFPQTCRE